MNAALQTLRDWLAPESNTCHLCGTLLYGGEAVLCESCESGLEACRIPPVEAVSRLGEPLDLSLCAYWHQDEARELVHRLKFGHDLAAALPLAYGMAAAYGRHRALIGAVDRAVAVPSHFSRLRERGYNQAEKLAEAFCGVAGVPLSLGGLARTRRGRSQVYNTREERLHAMTGAFAANVGFDGLSLLLVDDVLTTGATAAACTQCLLAAGARRVVLLTACRA